MCKSNCCGSGAMCTVSLFAKILLIVGGVNWGIVGVGMLMDADWNVVEMLLGSWPMVEAIVYILVGVSAVVKIFGCRCNTCASDTTGAPSMDKPM